METAWPSTLHESRKSRAMRRENIYCNNLILKKGKWKESSENNNQFLLQAMTELKEGKKMVLESIIQSLTRLIIKILSSSTYISSMCVQYFTSHMNFIFIMVTICCNSLKMILDRHDS